MLSLKGDKVVGGGGSSRPLDKGGGRSPKNSFSAFGPQFGLKRSGGGGGGGAPLLDPPLLETTTKG